MATYRRRPRHLRRRRLLLPLPPSVPPLEASIEPITEARWGHWLLPLGAWVQSSEGVLDSTYALPAPPELEATSLRETSLQELRHLPGML